MVRSDWLCWEFANPQNRLHKIIAAAQALEWGNDLGCSLVPLVHLGLADMY